LLLDTGSDVDVVTDRSGLQLGAAADGASNYHIGVDPDANPKRTGEAPFVDGSSVSQYFGFQNSFGGANHGLARE
jgi:hypothetical protein